MQRHTSKAQTEIAPAHLFEEHCSDFYWLAFLLTGAREKSIQAFTTALDLTSGMSPTFQKFMASWARKLLVAAALGTIQSELRNSVLRAERSRDRDFDGLDNLPAHAWVNTRNTTRSELERAVLAIDVLPRCALLLTVFENLPIKDVALLLGVGERRVRTAQSQGAIELTRNLALGRGWDPAHANPDLSLRHLRVRVHEYLRNAI